MTILPSLSPSLAHASHAAEPRPRAAAREPEPPRAFARALGQARSEPGRRADAAGPAAEGPAETAAEDRAAGRAARGADEAGGRDERAGTATAEAPPAARPRGPGTPGTPGAETAGAPPADAAAGDHDTLAAPEDRSATPLGAAAGSGSRFAPSAGLLPGRAAAGPRGAAAAAEATTAGLRRQGDDAPAPPAVAGFGMAEATGRAAGARTESGAFANALAAALPTPAAPGPGATTGPSPGAPAAEAQLASHPASASFGGELSARLVTFVREGIEQARLHLNPAEMGPVEVRIAIEGDAARVLMAAEQAPTRQWLEQALPTLAAGLREAGITLAGGGVFDRAPDGQAHQAGQQAGPQGRGRPTGGPGDAGLATDVATSAVAGPRRRGVVDLVA